MSAKLKKMIVIDPTKDVLILLDHTDVRVFKVVELDIR